MPSISRTVLLAAQAAALVAFLASPPMAEATALASPGAMPMPLMARTHSLVPRSAGEAKKARVKHENHTHTIHPARNLITTMPYRRDAQDDLQKYQLKANNGAQKLQTLAAQSSDGSNKVSQQEAASELTEFHTNMLECLDLLKGMAGDKGLQNYDRSQVQTLLKDIVNTNKDILAATTTLVYNIPVLGPILGPIVYEIKCILEDTLNAVENISDELFNELKPLIASLLPTIAALL